MSRFMRSIAVVVGLGSTMVGLMPGCSNRLGPVIATQEGGIDRPSLPDIFVEKAKACVAEHGAQLEAQHYRFDSKVDVDEDGYKHDITIDGIPDTAPDLGACLRIALQDMPIAEEPFRQGVETLKYRREQALAEQRKLMGHPVVIVVAGVTIVVSEIVLEAGAITILTAVTVKVVDKAVDDVAELAKKRRWFKKDECTDHYEKCMNTAAGDAAGNHWKQSLCGICASVCINNVTNKTGSWPPRVGNGSCEYWQPQWN